ncbi:hypothetical protein AVEN_95093-1 [Araneus ventricosus]|uniref:Uncharacterized protein n=1 Tax=Araneus ventricosus TaxID=182803 RepID=A0A4Y2NZD7_ARAVE|nr:hypothetical protein AVEN_95093-1 [Araneus ventricosus]
MFLPNTACWNGKSIDSGSLQREAPNGVLERQFISHGRTLEKAGSRLRKPGARNSMRTNSLEQRPRRQDFSGSGSENRERNRVVFWFEVTTL